MGTAAPPRKKLPHLQGIRGLAIIAITLFHFFPKYFSNGYLGVDMWAIFSIFSQEIKIFRPVRLPNDHDVEPASQDRPRGDSRLPVPAD